MTVIWPFLLKDQLIWIGILRRLLIMTIKKLETNLEFKHNPLKLTMDLTQNNSKKLLLEIETMNRPSKTFS